MAFWTACALVGGPLFGLAGRLWRTAAPERKGLGMAILAGVFVAEGLYAYWHQLHHHLTAALWIGIGAALALLAGRERIVQLRWLGLTIPLGRRRRGRAHIASPSLLGRQAVERGLQDRLDVAGSPRIVAIGDDHVEDLLEREVGADLARALRGGEQRRGRRRARARGSR